MPTRRAKTTRKTQAKRPSWQFAWCDADSPPRNGDSHNWKSKTIRARDFITALDRMLEFIENKPYNCIVDHEVRANHIPYRKDKHERTYPRICTTKHPINQYVN